jgi:hypothetical protein
MISLDEAQRILGPYHGDLLDCTMNGWNVFISQIAPNYPPFEKRTRRNLVNNLIMHEVTKCFFEVPGTHISTFHGRSVLQIGPLVVRFKKVDEDLRTSNFPTPTALLFDGQAPLPGIPRGDRVTVGYLLNEFETSILGVFVILAKSDSVLWSYELSVAMDLVELFPRGTDRPISEAMEPTTRVKPRKTNLRLVKPEMYPRK